MKHKADIGFVYAHAKGVGGDHDAHFSTAPTFLTLVLLEASQSGMIERCRLPKFVELLCQFVAFAAAARVDDAGAWDGLQGTDDAVQDDVLMLHDVCQVLPAEAHPQDVVFAKL